METETIKDAAGRVLTLRQIGVVQQARLLRAIGADQARNEPYTNMVFQAAMVDAIDGVPLPFPANERQIDAMLEKVGDGGFAVLIMRSIAAQKKFMDDAEAALKEDAPAAHPLEQSGPS